MVAGALTIGLIAGPANHDAAIAVHGVQAHLPVALKGAEADEALVCRRPANGAVVACCVGGHATDDRAVIACEEGPTERTAFQEAERSMSPESRCQTKPWM